MRKDKFLLSNPFNTLVVYNFEVPRHFVTQRLDIVQNSYLFDTKNYALRLDIVHSFSSLIFLENLSPSIY